MMKICSNCVMDTSDSKIIFDDYGAHPDVQKAVNSHQWKKMTDIGYYNELPNYNEEVDGSEGVICEI